MADKFNYAEAFNILSANQGKLTILRKKYPRENISTLGVITSAFHWHSRPSIRQALKGFSVADIVREYRKCNAA